MVPYKILWTYYKTKKGKGINTSERYHIHKNRKIYGKVLNDTYVEIENTVFEIIYKYEEK
jgi:hypothetical protein